MRPSLNAFGQYPWRRKVLNSSRMRWREMPPRCLRCSAETLSTPAAFPVFKCLIASSISSDVSRTSLETGWGSAFPRETPWYGVQTWLLDGGSHVERGVDKVEKYRCHPRRMSSPSNRQPLYSSLSMFALVLCWLRFFLTIWKKSLLFEAEADSILAIRLFLSCALDWRKHLLNDFLASKWSALASILQQI